MLKPAPGMIFVKKIEVKKGMIIIPDTSVLKEPVVGEVISVCDYYTEQGTKSDSFVKIGDTVIYHPQHTINFKVDDEEFTAVYITQVLAYGEKSGK